MSFGKPIRFGSLRDAPIEAHQIGPGAVKKGKVATNIDQTMPQAPTGLSAIRTFRGFSLSWNLGEESFLDYYMVQFAVSSDDQATWSDWVSIDVAIRSTIYPHQGLDSGLDYKYQVRVRSIAGIWSPWSDEYIAGKPGKVSLSEEVVGQLIREQLGPGVRGDLNQRVMAVPDGGVLWPFDQSLQSTRGVAPIAGSGTIYPADGKFSGAARTQGVLAYPFAGTDYTVCVYRDKGETWESYADLTWQQLIALLEVKHA